jgi:hypothetical protein
MSIYFKYYIDRDRKKEESVSLLPEIFYIIGRKDWWVKLIKVMSDGSESSIDLGEDSKLFVSRYNPARGKHGSLHIMVTEDNEKGASISLKVPDTATNDIIIKRGEEKIILEKGRNYSVNLDERDVKIYIADERPDLLIGRIEYQGNILRNTPLDPLDRIYHGLCKIDTLVRLNNKEEANKLLKEVEDLIAENGSKIDSSLRDNWIKKIMHYKELLGVKIDENFVRNVYLDLIEKVLPISKMLREKYPKDDEVERLNENIESIIGSYRLYKNNKKSSSK